MFSQTNPFWLWMGLQIDDRAADRGEAVVKVTIRPEFLQHQRMVHGGVVSALVDSAGAWAFFLSHQEGVRTINLAVQYLNPVAADTLELEAHAMIVRVGGRVVFADVEVLGGSRLTVARGQVIYSRARKP